MGKLDGKVALITGAASGIGRATALLFSEEGAKVAVADCVSDGGQETVRMVKEAGGDAIFIETDVSKAADVQRMIKTTMDTYGRIDILHNNAAIQGKLLPVEELTEEDFDSVIRINLRSVFLGSKYTIPIMLKQGGGVIVNTASVAGIIGLEVMPAYCASKGGVVQLTKAMALKYAKQNIRVNCICPGGVETPMLGVEIPTDPEQRAALLDSVHGGRFIYPEEIARAALYLASDDSTSCIGAVLVVDRGLTAT
ncbi:SDR family NAD(P)-dependent oxidoreductase [Chloroflexota bacterium]